MNKRMLRRITAAAFLTIGYVACLLQWLWLVIVGLPRLVESGALDVLTKTPEAKPTVVQTGAGDSPLLWAVVGIATLGILIMTVVVLIRLPRSIVHGGEKLVGHTAEVMLPVMTHHKPLPPKKRAALSRRVMFTIQICLSVLPFICCLFLPAYHELTRAVIVSIAALFAALSLVGFTTAWLVRPAATSRTRSRASHG